MNPPIRFGKRGGLESRPSPGELARLRREFDESLVVRLPGFLDPELLAAVQDGIDSDRFPTVDDSAGCRIFIMERTRLDLSFTMLLNDPRLLGLIGLISGLEVQGFQGRFFRYGADDPGHIAWHDDFDASGARLAGLSVAFGRVRFRGGKFEIRRGNGKPSASFVNARAGDGFLFRIGKDLTHRNTPLRGDVRKTAFAGWFGAAPFLPSIKRRVEES